MPIIVLETNIKSSLEICFDLARSIDLHKISTEKTNEEAIEGTTKGLINLNEFVTWQATHFGVKQKLTSKITEFDRPYHFRDEQTKGAFKSIVHDHYFKKTENYVVMKDIFDFQSPFGIFGRVFNKLILIRYLTNLLIDRNNIIKDFAESGKGELLLK